MSHALLLIQIQHTQLLIYMKKLVIDFGTHRVNLYLYLPVRALQIPPIVLIKSAYV
jgi:hypothetical protein